MRFLTALLLSFAMMATVRSADKPVDPVKLVAAIEKTGAKVTMVDAAPGETRLKLSFRKWDPTKMTAFKGSPHIVEIVIEDAGKVSDQSMALFASLPNLERLELYKPALTAASLNPFKANKSLKYLTLFGAKIGDGAVAALKEVETLEELDLTGSLITNASAEIFKDLPNLKILAVANTKFNGKGALQLKEMPKLKELNAMNCDVSVMEAKELEAAIKGIKVKR
ncbi:leucine-rich repeat domain-containing protein [Zavarzinella formosa]|uniref:hypothetical protein n=1 Tax=Zavarzinella formosa TaxID=360055 RepID=UPI00030808DD|nr:hypothetical protein [Zavarzinella formosa]